HPFVGLDVIDASVRGNTAYLKFQKFKQPDSPIISIKLYWIGGGWLIVDDSLFGKEGLIAELSQSLRAAT
ncbi:MAG: hypothetical protein IT291_08250, partial [Deltaproteobacteria bacterium]|nr:hypothetical protein [Deltaproteobacteria bacterium]